MSCVASDDFAFNRMKMNQDGEKKENNPIKKGKTHPLIIFVSELILVAKIKMASGETYRLMPSSYKKCNEESTQ